jgi:hypothetical protein
MKKKSLKRECVTGARGRGARIVSFVLMVKKEIFGVVNTSRVNIAMVKDHPFALIATEPVNDKNTLSFCLSISVSMSLPCPVFSSVFGIVHNNHLCVIMLKIEK